MTTRHHQPARRIARRRQLEQPYGIAPAYAGHTDSTGPATTTYIKANLQEVATALAAMTGQPHPLAMDR